MGGTDNWSKGGVRRLYLGERISRYQGDRGEGIDVYNSVLSE